MARYTFGADEPAVQRLALVSSAYEPVSKAFLSEHAPSRPSVALDLGCGPGFSTALVGEVCRPRRLIGVDSSEHLLAVARARLPEARFEQHDAADTPLPGAPAEIIYARLLLAHLPDPAGTAERWRADLAPGGVLLIEDLEAIEAPAGPLRTYDAISADIVRSGGGVMYAGPALARLGGRCAAVTVPARQAARIYLFNVRRWLAGTADPESRDELRRLEADLVATAACDGDGDGTVSWIVRQIAVPA